jgi:hypothetical protein
MRPALRLVTFGVLVIPLSFLFAAVVATAARGQTTTPPASVASSATNGLTATPTAGPTEGQPGLSDSDVVWCGSHASGVGTSAGLLRLVSSPDARTGSVTVNGTPEPVSKWQSEHEPDYRRACLAARAAAFPPSSPPSVELTLIEGGSVALLGAVGGVAATAGVERRRRKKEAITRKTAERQREADDLAAQSERLFTHAANYVGADIAARPALRPDLDAELAKVRQGLVRLRREHKTWFKSGTPLAATQAEVVADLFGRLNDDSTPSSAEYEEVREVMVRLVDRTILVQDAEYGDVRARNRLAASA